MRRVKAKRIKCWELIIDITQPATFACFKISEKRVVFRRILR